MKRCPECRRDYYDDTLLYCLDDGFALLDGPAPASEKKTLLYSDRSPTGADAKASSERGIVRHVLASLGRRTTIVVLLAVAAAIFGGYEVYLYLKNTQAPSEGQIKSIAILPLRSLDSRDDSLGLGIADAVIRSLSQTGQILVRPTSSVRRFLNEETDGLAAAKLLSVDAVLEGTIQRTDKRLRVTINLLRSADGSSLWADNFDMQAADIFSIQDTVAKQLVSKLRLQLDPEQRARLAKRTAVNPVAYELYIKGVYAFDLRGFGNFSKEQLDGAIDTFKKAIEIEPDYALAHAQLGFAYIWKAILVDLDQQQKWVEIGTAELARADELEPGLPETRLARARLMWSGYSGWQVENAVREIILAQKSNPSIGHVELASIYYHVGLEALATKEFEKALEIDPTSEFAQNQFLFSYFATGRWDEYLLLLKKHYPERPIAPFYYVSKRDYSTAEKMLESLESDPSTSLEFTTRILIAAHRKDENAAEAQIALLLKNRNPLSSAYHHDTYDIACAYAILGKTDKAIKWLKDTIEDGYPNYTHFERDPYLDGIRATEEFKLLMGSLKSKFNGWKQEFEATR